MAEYDLPRRWSRPGRPLDHQAAHPRAPAPGGAPGLPPAARLAAPARLALAQRQNRGLRPDPGGVHRGGAADETGPVRMPDVRPVCAARHRVRVSDGLSQGTAQRAVRRRRGGRVVRGLSRAALCLGRGLRARGQPGPGRRPAPAAPAHRPPSLGRELVAELLAGPRRRIVDRRGWRYWPRGPQHQQHQSSAPGPGGLMSLRERLASGGFAITAEISPPRGASTGPITEKAALLRDWVDAVNITDNQGSNVRLASWAGSLAAMAAGLEPVMQMTCRDRNRIALQSDLLGASALGIRNVLVMTGDHPKFGDHPAAKPVFDLDSVQLLWTLRAMRDDHVLLSGRTLDPAPDCFLGAVENPVAPPAGFRADRLGKKVAAGAQFVQTQFVFDTEVFGRWMAQVRDLGLHERCYILAGVGAVRSRNALDFMRDKVPGVQVPDDVYRRLRAVPADQTAAEGTKLAAEIIQQLAAIDGVAGVHLLVAGNEQAVPGILDRAGVRVDRDGR